MFGRTRGENQWRGPTAIALLMLAIGARPALASGPGLSGRVFAIDEKGLIAGIVPGAAIEFKDQAGKSSARVTADANGFYKVDLTPGTYVFAVRAAGFKDEDAGRAVTLKRSDGYAVHNFSLSKGPADTTPKPPPPPVEIGILKGQVYEKTPEGSLLPLPGARVTLRPDRPGARPIGLVTRGAGVADPGSYATILSAGNYRGAASAPGFEPFADPNPITVVAGETATRDFMLKRITPPPPSGQGIRGMVTVFDPRKAGPPAIKVSIRPLTDPGTTIDPFAPDANGKFSRDLRPGRYQVVAEAEGFRAAVSGAREVFPGRYSIVYLRLVAEPPTEMVFVGTVYERIGEQPRRPLEGAAVLLRKVGEPLSTAQRGTSDAQGKVRLPVRIPGRYQAMARMAGYEPAGVPVEIASGETRADLELIKSEGPARSTFNLRVMEGKEPTAPPVPGAQILISQAGRQVATGSSDPAGRFSVQIPAGTYRVDVSRTGHVPGRLDFIMADRDVNRIVILPRRDFPPPPPGKLTLTVEAVERVAGAVRAVPGADVVISHEGRRITTGRTGADGRYSTPLPADTYHVDVSRDGYVPTDTDVTLATEDVRRQVVLVRRDMPPPPGEKVKLTLTAVEQLRGGVRPIAGARIDISHDGRRVALGVSGPDGRFEVRLPADTYHVDVTRDGFTPADADVTLADRDVSRQIALVRRIVPPADRPTLDVAVVERFGSAALRPVAGADVVISQAGRRVAGGTTNAQGRFAVDLASGTYLVAVSKSGYTSASVPVALADRDVSRQIVLTRGDSPQPPGEKAGLTLRIVERSKMMAVPLPGADIVISQQGRSILSGHSDRSGEYSARLPAGTYRVDVSREGYTSSSLTVALADQDVTREVALVKRDLPPPPQGGTLTVTIKGAALKGLARPLPGAQVVVTGPGGTRVGKSDASGRYVVQLPAGNYRIKVTNPPNYQPAETEAAISSGAVTRDIVLARVKID